MNSEFKISSEEKRFLLKIAREAIKKAFLKEDFEVKEIPKTLAFNAGCFVTLHLNGSLRGCIGNFRENVNIVKNVIEMAKSAAFEDPRFLPISSLDELNSCEIEISILSPMIRCKPEDIVVGRDGIYIRRGYCSGVLLPQVAVENNFDQETFLDHTCLKAGLKPGCWRMPDVEIYRFEAIVFSEKDLS